jgi:hypothetical protein
MITNLPWMAKCIKEVVIYVGNIDKNKFRHEMNHNFEAVIADVVAEQKQDYNLEDWDREVTKLIECIESNVGRHCDPVRLSHAFSRLARVESLRVISRELPIQDWNSGIHCACDEMFFNVGRHSAG